MREDDFYDEDEMENFICLDCGVDTDEIREYYMLTDEVWKEAVPDLVGTLCISCVELQLGRQLWPEDFMEAPLNYMHSVMSARVLARFFGITDAEAEELQEILNNRKKITSQIIGELRSQHMEGLNNLQGSVSEILS